MTEQERAEALANHLKRHVPQPFLTPQEQDRITRTLAREYGISVTEPIDFLLRNGNVDER